MSLLSRKRTILAKLESVYGTDPTPTGSANAILITNLTVNPLDAEVVSRDVIRPYLGISDRLIAQAKVAVEFEIELAGSGSPGVAPAWGPLLKACGFAEALNTAAVTITLSGSVATATLTAHGFTVGSKVTISGATQPEYNGVQTITAVTTNTFSYAVVGTPVTPATGSPIAGTNAVYSPVSSAFPSLTVYFTNDSVLHKVTGARGSVEVLLAVKALPKLKFSFTGIYNAPADVTAPTVDFSAFQQPKIANTLNTTSFSLLGFSGYLEQMSLNMANTINYRTLIGYEEVTLTDRAPAGSFVIEAPSIASKDFFSIARAGTTGAMTITHGTASGNKVRVDCPKVSLQNPNYQDSNGVQMLSIPFVATPNVGNDEVTFTVL
jgi:hypothetical protein